MSGLEMLFSITNGCLLGFIMVIYSELKELRKRVKWLIKKEVVNQKRG